MLGTHRGALLWNINSASLEQFFGSQVYVVGHPPPLHFYHGPLMECTLLSISEHFWHNDIALVKLAEDVPAAPDLVERIQKVTLPEQTDSLAWPEDVSECVL